MAYKQNANQQIKTSLSVAKRVFNRLVEVQGQRLSESAFFLASDFGFKQVVATQGHKTIISALNNIQHRIGADAAMLVSLDLVLRADTLNPDDTGIFFASELVKKAQRAGKATAIVLIDGKPHQMVVVPTMAPNAIGWLCVSFKISHMLVDDIQQLTQSHISLLGIWPSGQISLLTSSLPDSTSQALVSKLSNTDWRNLDSVSLTLDQTLTVAAAATNDCPPIGFRTCIRNQCIRVGTKNKYAQ